MFFIVFASIYVLTNSAQISPFTTSLLKLVICCLFYNGHSDIWEVIPHCGLICISLMTTDTEHLFILLLSLYVFSFEKYLFRSSRFSSVAQLCPNLCDPTDCSTPGLSVHLQLPEFTQTHVHRVCDAIQPSHPLLSPSPPAFNLSQHHGLFRWVSSSHQVAKVLEFQLQHQSFQWIFRSDFLYDVLVGSHCSPRNSQESSPTPQFKSISSLVLSFLYNPTLTSIYDHWKNHTFD